MTRKALTGGSGRISGQRSARKFVAAAASGVIAAEVGITSPLTGSSDVTLERVFPAHALIAGYRTYLGIDVSEYFAATDEVRLVRCNQSGYRFFHPYSIAAGARLYAELRDKYGWYYMSWKHEYDVALQHLAGATRVLEIGCGNGAFLQRIRDAGGDGVGLELTPQAVSAARALGLNVRDEPIESHAARHEGAYDAVCIFQTLEHTVHVRSFLGAAVRVLKPGGLLCISVPNNSSFLGILQHDWLNLPPHHMGRWDEESIRSIVRFFPLRVREVLAEPLQPQHRDGFVAALQQIVTRRSPVFGRIAMRVVRPLLRGAVAELASGIKGHTIIAVFERQ